MPRGTVKWFNNAKGFGFILPDEGGTDLFAHYSSIEMEGYRTLKAGQSVIFDVEQGEKGLHASHIKACSTDSSTTAKTSQNSDAQEGVSEESQLAEAH